MVEAEIYFSALDTLLGKRFGSDTVWHVVDTIYWWPLATRHPQVALEEAPRDIPEAGREASRLIDFVRFKDAVTESGTRRFPGPLVILGPIDMLGEDEALFRVNLYLGLNGQELNRLRCRRVDGRWRVVEIAPEVAT